MERKRGKKKNVIEEEEKMIKREKGREKDV